MRPDCPRRALAALSLAVLVATLLPAAVLAAPPIQEGQELVMPSPEELARMMQEHMEAAQPGPEHERLASLVGSWEIEMTYWAGPGADPITFPATAEAEMILGGRFLRQITHSGDAIDGPTSIVHLGFDRRGGIYNLIAMDTNGTYWVTAQGEAVDDNRVVLSGSDWDEIVGGEQLYDFVLIWEDDGAFVSQIVFKDAIHTRGGPPHKMVETRARRVR